MTLFNGLSAFPITPIKDNKIDHHAYEKILRRLVDAQVDSIGALGSTGSYAYLSRQQRYEVAKIALEATDEIPVLVSIGAINEYDTLSLAEDAQKIGINALLLPAMSYFPLRDEEVFSLYKNVNDNVNVPIIIYDTPGTTQFNFSDDLLEKICALKNVKSVKIPSAYPTHPEAMTRLKRLSEKLPQDIILGVSGDPDAAEGLKIAKVWYSEWGGLFPQAAKTLTEAALKNDQETIQKQIEIFAPFWQLSTLYGGSLRVIASTAALMGLTDGINLPAPLQGISKTDQDKVSELLKKYNPS